MFNPTNHSRRPFNVSLARLGSFVGSLGLSTLGILAIATAPPANAQGNSATYPSSFVDLYLKNCVSRTTSDAERLGIELNKVDGFCKCSLEELQDRYTFEEVQAQSSDVDILAIACDCAIELDVSALAAQCKEAK
ncbi:MAG: hypothetical protein AAF889_06895 [Cyanobacteria bacterium P01_D01_bin.73]